MSFPVARVGPLDERRLTRRTGGVRERKAPLCRVGRSMNLRKAGGTAQTSRASGFLATEACTPRGVATHLGETLAQTSLPPSRAKQGTQTLEAILVGSRSRVQGSVRFAIAASTISVGRRTVRLRTPSGRDRASVRAPRRARPARPSRAWLTSRQRNSSSAMFSAASTARRSESPVGVDSAAARIFSST